MFLVLTAIRLLIDMPDYLITVRNIRRGEFGNEPGRVRFLKNPSNRTPKPAHAISRKQWAEEVMAAAHNGQVALSGEDCGDIVAFVHGYNTSPASVAHRHRQLKKDLPIAGFAGAIVSLDWPGDDRAISYLEDRSDAKIAALRLVDDGISLLAATQYRGCKINLHIVAHSMGAYLVRQAFDDADDRPAIAASNWTVSQLCLVSADVSAASMSASDARSRSMYRHSTRLTNYQNPYDTALKLSDVKRVGVAPRVGRNGLPDDHPDKATNVDCGDYYDEHYGNTDDNGHSWYFTDRLFLSDLAQTLRGDHDQRVVGARRVDGQGELKLA